MHDLPNPDTAPLPRYLLEPDENGVVEVHAEPATITPITARELLMMDLPVRRTLLHPWLPEQGAALLYAPRGVGKTFLALSVAYAVATGGTLLRWQAQEPRRVVYIDGEMPAVSLQERLAGIAAGSDWAMPADDYLRFIPQDLYRDGLPDLASAEGRKLVEGLADGADFVVFDNLSSLIRSPENEADGWQPMHDLVLSLRRRHTSTLIIHHAGKGGDQRGTSRREDIMDSVLSLRRPEGYDARQGAQFEVHFTKARGFTGADAAPFVATLNISADKRMTWEHSDLSVGDKDLAFEMFGNGAKPAEVMSALKVSKATAYRWQREWKEGRGDG